MAGKVKGYSRAKKIFNVCGLCGVGMAPNGSQTEDIKKANNIPNNLSVFSLQGGFEMEKLSGVYKLMMNTMKSTLAKQIANKKDKSPQEEEMLELILNGGNRVCKESLKPIITWIKNQ